MNTLFETTEPPTTKAPSNTPWGAKQYERADAPGVIHVGTASHGGYYVDQRLNKAIPAKVRNANGWYEEDCQWAIPYVFLMHRMKEHDPRFAEVYPIAVETLKQWEPDAYEIHTGEKLKEGESGQRDRANYETDHAGKYQVSAAWGHPTTLGPKPTIEGYVLVVARPVGNQQGEDQYYQVPSASYKGRKTVSGNTLMEWMPDAIKI